MIPYIEEAGINIGPKNMGILLKDFFRSYMSIYIR